jgi:outer membrane lipoprotein-sorting protein
MNRHRILVRLATIVLAVCVAGSALAQPDAALPDAKQLWEKYIEATGGRATYEKFTSRVTRATLNIPAANINGAIINYQQAPNLGATEMQLPGFGNVNRGFNGTTGWESSPATGSRLVEGQELELMQREMSINSELDPEKWFTKMETVGIGDVDKKPAYKVATTSKAGANETRYFDKESGLLVKSEMSVETQMGKIDAVTTVSDYREVDGIKIPFSTTQTAAGQQFTVTIEKVEHNVPIPPEKFDPPAEVKKLMEKGTAAPATKPG